MDDRLKSFCGVGLYAPLTLIMLLLFTACTCRDSNEPTQPASPVNPSSGRITQDPEVPPTLSHADMRVIALSGEPLSGMMPIATLQPNAFDKPVATGKLTDESGKSSISFPVDQKLAVRAWDPDLFYFPNNFYDVFPQSGAIQETLVISMVRSASIEAVLIGPEGTPLQHDNAGIMLFHPVHGPWWPAEANTDDKGAVLFYRVPPGSYVIRIKVASGPMIELPETYIAPGETTPLGAVHLH